MQSTFRLHLPDNLVKIALRKEIIIPVNPVLLLLVYLNLFGRDGTKQPVDGPSIVGVNRFNFHP
jgi:hypothetical protein